MQTAVTSTGGMETCCSLNPFLANQQALLLLQALLFYGLSSECNRTQIYLCFYYVHDFSLLFFSLYFCVLCLFVFFGPSCPAYILASSKFKAVGTENTVSSHRDSGLLLVRWSRLLLPITSEHHCGVENRQEKEKVPNIAFHETNQLLRVF